MGRLAGDGGAESLDEKLVSEGETGIIGTENRVRITNTVAVPFRWICQIAIEDQRGRPLGGGTGVLVSDRHVLTAAHVVDDAYKNPHQHSIYVTPARNYGDEPFGKYLVLARPKLPSNYDANAESDIRFEYDYALLTLPEPIGTKTFSKLQGRLCFWGSETCGEGTLFRRLDPAALAGKKALTAGYPGRKGGDKLYCSVGMLHSVGLRGHLRTMRIQADATQGQSGSPVWLKVKGNPCLVGVLVGAGERTNTVVRVTRELRAQVISWIAEDAGTSSMREAEEWSRLDAEVDEVVVESDSAGESSESEGQQGYEPQWQQEKPAEEDEEPAEPAIVSEECEGELDADDETNDDAGSVETESGVPDHWAADGERVQGEDEDDGPTNPTEEGQGAFVPDEPEWLEEDGDLTDVGEKWGDAFTHDGTHVLGTEIEENEP